MGRQPRHSGEDFVFSIDGLKKLFKPANGLGLAQEQKAFWLEGVVQGRQNLSLQVRLEINQQIPATDQVYPREGRVAQKIVPGENKHVANELGDAVASGFLDKEAAQSFPRKVMHEVFGIITGAAFFKHRLIEVGREKLELASVAGGIREFQ